MPRKRKAYRVAPEAEDFLRSINLCFDAEEPERIAHFRPTAKSVPLIAGLLADASERAFLVVAPYGSGKSLTLTYLLHAIENRPESQSMLSSVEQRLDVISPSLRKTLLSRRRTKKHGLVLALHGYQKDLGKAVQEAAYSAIRRNKLGRQARRLTDRSVEGMEDAVGFLQELKQVCLSAGCDQICILWDETGRHLESLIADGRATELSDIQLLAEYASRSTDVPVTLGITLHQSMLHYAQQMTQSVRAEWLKISGRFETVQYVDDSKEIYRLVADIITSNRGAVDLPSKRALRDLAKEAKDTHGMFSDFTLAELADLFESIYPASPAAVYLLPRISARVAQNERTLFTFLYAVSLADGFSVADLYDYFSPSMRGDTAVGGTHKQWLETESALSKTTGDEQEVQVIKAACLLSLGTKGERSRVGLDTLLWSLAGFDSSREWHDTVSDLLKKKLLLYREHSQEVSVWHGTDVDLRGRLLEEQDRHRATFDVLAFLNKDASPEPLKPIEYNAEYGVTRYWPGEYLLAKDFASLVEEDGEGPQVPLGSDGLVYYVIAETGKQLCEVQAVAQELTHDQIIVALPSGPLNLIDAALEVWCLSSMQHNADLTGEDPLVLPELQQMLDDARANLHAVLDKLVRPAPDGPRWYYKGQPIAVTSVSDMRRQLSAITRDIFSSTPRIHNELINRHKPSGTIVNSRKKLLMGILERHGSPELVTVPTTPDASMFRTILMHTGLYRHNGDGSWGYVSGKTNSLPEDHGLKETWNRLREFFEVPSDAPKRPRELLDALVAPPFGIRRGLLPIFFAAGMKAFGKAISLRNGRNYVADILPSVVEDLCRNPDDYEIVVIALDPQTDEYLATVREVFGGSSLLDLDTDLVRATYDAIQSWLFQLPKSALTADHLPKRTKDFQRLLQNAREMDPLVFVLQQLPEVCGFDRNHCEEARETLGRLKSELESVSDTYVRKAASSVHQALARAHNDSSQGIQKLAKQWAGYFPEALAATGLPGIARGLLSRMKMSYDDDELFVNSLALLLVGRPIDDWDASTAIEFDGKIQELVHRIETTALRQSTVADFEDAEEVRDGLSHLVAERIDDLYGQLTRLVGADKSRDIVASIMKGGGNGHSK